jgi:allophanate hydrolase
MTDARPPPAKPRREDLVTGTLASLLDAHRTGKISPADTAARTFARIREVDDPAIFIALREEAAVQAEAQALAARGNSQLPLYGVPVAVKDNIDVAGIATTAGCPAFAYTPARDATVIARLRAAGALVIGKTNLDQFATGLVGMRSPYGMPRNPLRGDLVCGGSSSGSAVAVATGIVPLALGTDTAGSGRVPAALNNIVGLKPSLGLLSNAGVVPACRSLDCVSIFALAAEDAFAALAAIAGPDAADPYSRAIPLGTMAAPPAGLRIAVPRAADRIFHGDREAEAAFDGALRIAERLGAGLVEIDLASFFEAARLLYEGPWVAERTAAVGEFIAQHPDKVHPVTRQIIGGGARANAVELFHGLHRLAELRAATREALAGIDALMVPSVPRPATVAEVEADPFGPNAVLGTYTNFVNLLDMAGLACPVSLGRHGTPYGVTFLGPSGSDALLASLGAAVQGETGLPLGALGIEHRPSKLAVSTPGPGEVAVAVVGAHRSGMALNHELRALGARCPETVRTAPDYQLFALGETEPRRPGLLRVAAGTGSAIEVETWALSAEAFGRFVAAVPPPLSIGSIRLGDGRLVKGFLVEAEGVVGARNISSFGSWPAFVAAGRRKPA